MTLGRYPEISLAKARGLANAARATIQQGVDAARQKRAASLERAAAKTFRELASDYVQKALPALAANTATQRIRHIRKDILPKLGSLPAREVRAVDIVAVIEAVGERSQSVAELVFTILSEIFKHGIAKRAVTQNPCAGISVRAICGRPEPKRKRIDLTTDELRAILPALDSIGPENALAVKILLATCTRLGELARAQWIHINFDRAEWLIPDENSKGKTGFVVPLSKPVLEWFAELQLLACGSKYVLPARQARRKRRLGGDVHFEQRTLNVNLERLCASLGEKTRRFTPHDLRSTARSHLAALGINFFVMERSLNHSLGGLVAVYDRHGYLDERRAALALWTDFIVAHASESRTIPRP